MFLFLNGIAAQEPQTETTNQKLDKLISYAQEKLHTWELAAQIANSDNSKFEGVITSIEACGQIILDNIENKMCPVCEACEVIGFSCSYQCLPTSVGNCVTLCHWWH